MKKILLGAFIVYNMFVMSTSAVLADTSLSYKTEMSSAKAEQNEVMQDVTASINDARLDIDSITEKDASIATTDLIESQKFEEQQPQDEKNTTATSADFDSTGTPPVTVLSPNGGEIYQPGQQIEIRWNSAYSSSSTAFIALYSSLTDERDEITITPNDGSEIVTLPLIGYQGGHPLASGNYYKIYIAIGGNPNLMDLSDNFFTIQTQNNPTGCDSTDTPGITVISPNGGEVYTAGQQMTVTWTSCDVPLNHDAIIGLFNVDNNTVIYFTDDPNIPTISTPNDGEETFPIPTSAYSGLITGNYKIRLSALAADNTTDLWDESNTTFRINSLAPSITVTSPNGGEVYQPGQTINISWTASGIDPNIGAEITLHSLNPAGGTAVGGAPVGGPSGSNFSYTIPSNYAPGLYEIIIRVADYNNNTLAIDFSDAPFILGGVTAPAGCVSPFLGYSPLTGIPCTNPVTWIAGCNSANGYSMTTGQPCNWTIVYPNVPQGCVTSQGFSVTTGQPCVVIITPTFCNPDDSTTVPAVDVLSPNGGEHFLPVEMPVSWRTCLIPASTQMSIDLVMSRTGSPDLVRHLATTINDGAETVSLPNTTTWPQMVYGNNFKVRIYPTSGPSYGPLDQSNQNFSIALARVIVATDPTTPPSRTTLVSNTASTQNVPLLKFTVTAEESDLDLRKIPVMITTGPYNISSLINTIKLYRGNDLIDSMDGGMGYDVVGGVITNNPSCTSTCGFIFSNLWNTIVPVGTTVSFTVAVDIKALGGNYPSGFSLISGITNESVLTPANFSVLDQNGDQLLPSQRAGFAHSQTQYFNTSVVNVAMGTSIISTVTNNGNVTQVTYSIPLTVSSVGATKYIGQTVELAVTPTGTNALAYVFNTAQNPAIADTTSIASSTLTSPNAIIEGNGYRLDDGATKHFTLTVTLITPSAQNSHYRVSLREIRTFTNGMLTTGGTNIALLPPHMYQTEFAFINN